MKEVLVIYYTQTGQLFDIVENIASTLKSAEINISYYKIQPIEPYEFPWKQEKFYDTCPESFLQIPAEFNLPEPGILDKKYDLILLGYQVWFLTPSRPINSFLKSEVAKKILLNTPVVTVVACRNMWIQAQEKMKRLLIENGALLKGHIALVDQLFFGFHIVVQAIKIAFWVFSRSPEYLTKTSRTPPDLGTPFERPC